MLGSDSNRMLLHLHANSLQIEPIFCKNTLTATPCLESDHAEAPGVQFPRSLFEPRGLLRASAKTCWTWSKILLIRFRCRAPPSELFCHLLHINTSDIRLTDPSSKHPEVFADALFH